MVENLLLQDSSYDAQVKIIDFGLAKFVENNDTCSFLGTKVSCYCPIGFEGSFE